MIRMMPTAIIVMSMIYFLRAMFTRMGSMGSRGGPGGIFSIGKSNAKLFDAKGKVKVSFKDVAGCEEVLLPLCQIML